MMVTGILAEKGFHAFDSEPRTHTGLESPNIWFVVASHEEAYIYRKTLHGLEAIAHAKARGKQMKSVDDHIFSPQSLNPDHHENTNPRHARPYDEDHAFIQRLIEWLNVAEKENAFDQLVIAAEPGTLGKIRSELTHGLQARVRAELNKELTKMSVGELQRHLDAIM